MKISIIYRSYMNNRRWFKTSFYINSNFLNLNFKKKILKIYSYNFYHYWSTIIVITIFKIFIKILLLDIFFEENIYKLILWDSII